MRKTLVLVGVIALGLLSVGNTEGQSDQPWVKQASFADFSQGKVADGGTNLYVAADGSIQMIHRWDYNNDGFLDIFVPQDHNIIENEDVLVYKGNKQGFKSLMPDLPTQQPLGRLLKEIHSREDGVTRLPSFGGGRSLMVDLNNDGYPDLVFCNYIHNYATEMNAIIYWGGPDGFSPGRRTLLPTLMANGVAAADFNRDGFVDLVFTNHGNEGGGHRFNHEKNLESYIYWNGPMGFSPERRTSIPSISGVDVAAGDLNGDGYPDLVIANNNEQEKSIYIYWGGSEGFSEKRRDIIRGGDPVGVQLADVDQDGKLDLIVEHADNRAVILRGTAKGFEEKPWVELPILRATECQVADLNKDGFLDLVFANPVTADWPVEQQTQKKQASYIYWGGAQGYSPERRTELPTLHAADAALADFNGDGWTDIAFANSRNETSWDVNSYVYWNGPHGFDAAHRSELQGFGTVSIQAGDFRKVGTPDLALISRNSGSFTQIDSVIYWGNPQHYYSPASMSSIPGIVDSGFVTGDFNRDGWVDVAGTGYIYWGGPEGYSVQRRQDLGIRTLNTAATADLNHDGYLDIVGTLSTPDYSSTKGVILWGSKNGYRWENRTELSLTANHPGFANIADLNKDGFLDLIYPDSDGYHLNIFWGNASGTYTNDRHTVLNVNPASTVQIADLNNDGWLDLILGAVYDPDNFGHPMRYLTILWGGPQGYSMDRSKRLEAYESEEQQVADLNKDGYLDIVAANYHAYTTRTLPVFIYWGGPGGYSESHRTNLPGESTLGLFVADLNEDGWMDLVAFNHVRNGDHGVGANIFWGGPDGYSYSRRQWLPTFGPHFNVRRDIGNIYTRKLEEEYISAPLRCPAGKAPSRLSWKAETPHGTAVKFQLRGAASKAGLEAVGWQGPRGSESYYEEPGTELNLPSDSTWVQYRAVFTTPDGGSTPVLHEIAIDVARGKAH